MKLQNTFWKPRKQPKFDINKFPVRTRKEWKMIDKNPYGDSDKDKVMNWFDCKPLDKRKQEKIPIIRHFDSKLLGETASGGYTKLSIKDIKRAKERVLKRTKLSDELSNKVLKNKTGEKKEHISKLIEDINSFLYKTKAKPTVEQYEDVERRIQEHAGKDETKKIPVILLHDSKIDEPEEKIIRHEMHHHFIKGRTSKFPSYRKLKKMAERAAEFEEFKKKPLWTKIPSMIIPYSANPFKPWSIYKAQGKEHAKFAAIKMAYPKEHVKEEIIVRMATERPKIYNRLKKHIEFERKGYKILGKNIYTKEEYAKSEPKPETLEKFNEELEKAKDKKELLEIKRLEKAAKKEEKAEARAEARENRKIKNGKELFKELGIERVGPEYTAEEREIMQSPDTGPSAQEIIDES